MVKFGIGLALGAALGVFGISGVLNTGKSVATTTVKVGSGIVAGMAK
jgi:hypothetical protein